MDMQRMKMEKVILLSCMFAASSAIFFNFNLPGTGQSLMNVCIYSMDPSRYQPKCFLCPSSVYTNVLQACLSAATIPRNITYTQAGCLEQNCGIRRGKRSVDLHPPENLLEEFGTRLSLDDEEEKGNVEDQQNGAQDASEGQQKGEQDVDENKESGDQDSDEDQQNGEPEDDMQVPQLDGYKVVGSEEFMASDVQDYVDYEDL